MNYYHSNIMQPLSPTCIDKYGCKSGAVPDFVIKRYSTKPSLNLIVEECGEPLDLTLVVVEVSMWANAKLKKAITSTDTLIYFADNVGFYQITTGDIIFVNHPRSPEQMLVVGFDEEDYIIEVVRGYGTTIPYDYKRGTELKIFRVLNANASTVMSYNDIMDLDGDVKKDVLTESKIVYDWSSTDTCFPGCFDLEFKLLKMVEGYQTLTTTNNYNDNVVGSTNSYVSYDAPLTQCNAIVGVDWVRRFPVESSYKIYISDTPNSEAVS